MRASVVVPTLHGGDSLQRCVRALEAQTCADFEVVVVDNSGRGAADGLVAGVPLRVVRNDRNVGFGAAINQGAAGSHSEYVCTLNDDAYPQPEWLGSLMEAADSDSRVGMCASLILLKDGSETVDSAGLGIYPDGTTKQIGQGQPRERFDAQSEALLPSGCAALYRRAMLDEVGWFDETYFLYGEDADIGLRGRLAGWGCLLEPGAVVSHDYSGSAGRASRLKAYYVERNRLFTVIKLFPATHVLAAPFHTPRRYLAHWQAAKSGEGLAGEFGFRESPLRLVLIVLQAHGAALAALPRLCSLRRRFGRQRKISPSEFGGLMDRHRLSAREIAAQ